VIDAASDKGVDKNHDRIMGERASNHSELTKLIIAASCDKVNMLRKTKFRVKSNSKITDRKGKCYIREKLCKLGQVNTL